MQNPQYLRIKQLSQHYCGGAARSTIYRWVAEDKMPPPIRLGGGVSVWRRADIENWIASKEAK